MEAIATSQHGWTKGRARELQALLREKFPKAKLRILVRDSDPVPFHLNPAVTFPSTMFEVHCWFIGLDGQVKHIRKRFSLEMKYEYEFVFWALDYTLVKYLIKKDEPLW